MLKLLAGNTFSFTFFYGYGNYVSAKTGLRKKLKLDTRLTVDTSQIRHFVIKSFPSTQYLF